MKTGIVLICMAAFLPPNAVLAAAPPNGLQDATAGYTALNSGSYDEAIRLFTRALSKGNLEPAHRVNAYLDRGLAYLQKGENQKAVADFRSALKLKPDDPDVQQYLAVALSKTPPQTTRATISRQSGQQALRADWGPLATFPGQYWLRSTEQPELYMFYQWSAPGTAISYSGLDRAGNLIAGQYQLDPSTHQISSIAVYRGKSTMGTVEIAPDRFIESGVSAKTPVRESVSRISASSFTITDEMFKNGAWKTVKSSTFVLASPTLVQALGWTPKPQQAKSESFLQGIGSALKAGALAGFQAGMQDGVHDAVQARTRGTLAPKAFPKGQAAVTVTTQP